MITMNFNFVAIVLFTWLIINKFFWLLQYCQYNLFIFSDPARGQGGGGGDKEEKKVMMELDTKENKRRQKGKKNNDGVTYL